MAIDAVEEHELPVDEVGVADAGVLGPAVVEEGVLLDAVEPALAVIDLVLGEGHVDEALRRWRLRRRARPCRRRRRRRGGPVLV